MTGTDRPDARDGGRPERYAGAAQPASAAPRARTLTAAEVAWVALLPCAAVAVAAIVLLGPPLGDLLFPPAPEGLWPRGWWEAMGRAEPAKQGRCLLAILAPALLAAAILVGARRGLRLRPTTARALVWAGWAAVPALAAAALLTQHPLITRIKAAPTVFPLGTVLAAGALLLAAVGVVRSPRALARAGALARETRAHRAAGLAVATAFAATWLLRAVTTDRLAGDATGLNLPWTLNDALAVLDGRTPLVDYHPIYAKLLPYPTALALAAFGTTILAYTLLMAVLDGLALLAVYAVFRSVTRSSLLALALFAPFVAASDVDPRIAPAGVGSPMTLSAMWPMRYGGVYLLAWLVARHVEGRRPRRPWVLFLVAGLVAINNLEFGLGAAVATLAALACARPPRSLRAAAGLAGSVAAGALAAAALVALGTLLRAGELPHPGLLLEWPRIFTNLGWFSMPLRTWDLHLAIYATFAAAVAVAAVRLADAQDDVLLTSMLAWSGVLGLLAGSYFVGRPDVFKLTGMLSAWSFALSLLTVACVRALAARGWRRPTPPQLTVLLGFCLTVLLLARMSSPQHEIVRLTRQRPDPVYLASAERFVHAHARRGQTVVILLPMSFRIAHDLGLRNVAPYAMMNAIVTRAQMRTVLDVTRRERVREVFTPQPGSFLLDEGDAAIAQLQRFVDVGFVPGAMEPGLVELRRTLSR